MSKIKKIINDDESVLVFDVDGVVAVMEWGEYNHFELDDNEWFIACEKGDNSYNEDKVSRTMQKFLKNKDMSRIYVITVIGHENEKIFKSKFLKEYYNIIEENIYYVKNNLEKKNELKKIKKKYPNMDSHKIVMIDDTVSVLNDILDNTNFSTAHISSFLDI